MAAVGILLAAAAGADVWEKATIAVSLVVLSACYAAGVRRAWRRGGFGRGIRAWQAGAFAAAMLALVAALLSPLDTLSDVRLSAHMVQHLLLLLVAAPLLAISAPLIALLWVLPAKRGQAAVRAWRRMPSLRAVARVVVHPFTAWALQAAALALWHVPLLYDAAVASDAVHALQHASYLGAATLFWWAVLERTAGARNAYGTGLLYVFAAAMQGALLGAMLTFGQQPWYVSHLEGAPGSTLSPLEDQHIGGAIMWVPGGMAYLLAIAVLLLLWLRSAERRTQQLERAAGRRTA